MKKTVVIIAAVLALAVSPVLTGDTAFSFNLFKTIEKSVNRSIEKSTNRIDRKLEESVEESIERPIERGTDNVAGSIDSKKNNVNEKIDKTVDSVTPAPGYGSTSASGKADEQYPPAEQEISSPWSREETVAVLNLSERERFLRANAEQTCYGMTTQQLGSTGEEGDPVVEIAKKYGFTLEELESLTAKYPNTEREVGMKSQKMCPEAWEGFRQFYQSLPDKWKQQQPQDEGKGLDYWKKQ